MYFINYNARLHIILLTDVDSFGLLGVSKGHISEKII